MAIVNQNIKKNGAAATVAVGYRRLSPDGGPAEDRISKVRIEIFTTLSEARISRTPAKVKKFLSANLTADGKDFKTKILFSKKCFDFANFLTEFRQNPDGQNLKI